MGIHIKKFKNAIHFRANGWVQDACIPNNVWLLCNAFDRTAPRFEQVVDNIKKLVAPKLAEKFLESLNNTPISLSYAEIVGHHIAGISRNLGSVCNGIGQAAIPGQKRDFLSDWATDNYLRFAVVLGFLSFSPETDSYQLTDLGKGFAKETSPVSRNSMMLNSVKKYAPARRVINLLSNGKLLNKFEIGEQIGFIGEEGFTNVGSKLFQSLYETSNEADKKALLSNKEGSADKYARTICAWLKNLGLVCIDKSQKPQKYGLTPQGYEFQRQMTISKHINCEFSSLSMTKGNRLYNCRRRSLLLYLVQESKITKSGSLVSLLKAKFSIDTSIEQIRDDISSLFRTGIDIKEENNVITLNSIIDNLIIPDIQYPESDDLVDKTKKYLQNVLKHVNHDLLKLVDFSVGGQSQSAWFELYTSKAFEAFCDNVHLLGGPYQPDVICQYKSLGLIIDSKAYKKGFSATRSQKDEMTRYINEADMRRDIDNATNWWELFDKKVTNFAFIYVSSSFSKEISNQLVDISQRTTNLRKGSAIDAKNLLLLADKAQESNIDESIFQTNSLIEIEQTLR